jgi:L-ascorbate metabolism protein UlaG (beta-lactamase superfamily)
VRIRHFLYNAFLIENEQNRIAIDPGQHFSLFNFTSLIPESEWGGISHILVTHGDPDHYWQADRVAAASHAPVVCGKDLARVEDGKILLVAPRGKELTSWIPFENAHPLDTGGAVVLGDVEVEAIKTVHGPIRVPILWFEVEKHPGPGERVGIGATGFRIRLGGKSLVNLGDTIFQEEWEGLKPDVLMLPIGGLGNNCWTMDVSEALEAVRLIKPKLVIPCHYNIPFLWIRNMAPADDHYFKAQVEKMGVECTLMHRGDELVV